MSMPTTASLASQLEQKRFSVFQVFHNALVKNPWLPIVLIIGLGVLSRFLASGMRVFVSPDSMAYWYTTEAILKGDWIHTYVERTPGYPFFLILVQAVASLFQPILNVTDGQALFQKILLILQSGLGIINAILVSTCVKRISQNNILAFYAGVAMLFLPDLLLYEHAFLTETLYTTSLLTWFLMFLFCQKASEQTVTDQAWILKVAGLGLITGWLMLVKPIAISIALCAVVWFWLNKRQTWQSIIVYGAIIIACALPWMIMNANTHGTFTLAAGKGANQLYKMIDSVDWQSPLAGEYKIQLHQRYLLHPEGETYNAVNDAHVLMDQQLQRKPNYSAVYLQHDENAGLIAWEAILRHPFSWVYQTGKQWLDFYIKPANPIVRLPIFSLWSIVSSQIWQVLLLLSTVGAVIAFYNRNTALLMPAAMIVSHATFYAFSTLADARYHIPLEPFALILTVYVISQFTSSPVDGRRVEAQVL